MKRHNFPLILFFSLSCLAGQDIRFIPDKWELTSEENSPFFTEGISVEIENLSGREITLRFILSRPEMSAEPAVLTLGGNETGRAVFFWKGEIPPEGERIFPVVILPRGGTAQERFMIYSPRDYLAGQIEADGENYDRRFVYYFSPSCRDCREFLEREIPRLEEETGLSIGLERVNIYDEEGMARLRERLEQAGIQTDALPILDTGDFILAGDSEIRDSLEAVLKGEYRPGSEQVSSAAMAVPLWALVGGAGLLDGINPCAFSTLIFLLAYLGLRERDRREILAVGISFTLTVFITYTAVGAGAFLFLKKSMGYPWISAFLKWGGASVLLVLGLLSMRDWYRVKKGETSDLTLQLSPRMKKAVHRSVRGGVRSALPVLGACGMGFFVTIYELGCTGQIYLPTLYLMIRKGEGSGILLLILYNLAFILPLAVVFLLAYRGLTSEKLGVWFREKLGTVKILTALFFLAAGALVILL